MTICRTVHHRLLISNLYCRIRPTTSGASTMLITVLQALWPMEMNPAFNARVTYAMLSYDRAAFLVCKVWLQGFGWEEDCQCSWKSRQQKDLTTGESPLTGQFGRDLVLTLKCCFPCRKQTGAGLRLWTSFLLCHLTSRALASKLRKSTSDALFKANFRPLLLNLSVCTDRCSYETKSHEVIWLEVKVIVRRCLLTSWQACEWLKARLHTTTKKPLMAKELSILPSNYQESF